MLNPEPSTLDRRIPGSAHLRVTPVASFVLLSVLLALPILLMLVLGLGLVSGQDAGFADPGLWPCLFTASVAAFLSAWIWSLRGSDTAALLFCASGASTYAFCLGAALFNLPLVLSETAISIAIIVNVVGASGFGVAMIVLFTRYPIILPRASIIANVAAVVFGAWTLFAILGPVNVLIEIHRITLVEMIVILILAGAQIRASRNDPVARTIAVWLGSTVTIGAGSFIALVALPNALLRAPFVREEFGFLFFTIIYVALAVALVRYRVFGLGRWAYQLLFLVAAALAVLAIDAVIILALALDATQAAGIALVVIALLYLPVRAWLWERIATPKSRDRKLTLSEATKVALAPTEAERRAAWQDLFLNTFEPLKIEPSTEPIAMAIIRDDGRELVTSAPPGFTGFQLSDRDRGRRLFTPEDGALADELVALVSQLDEARTAYERGATFERTRIARDIHDNIGAHLLTALHAPASERKDELIRETLTDLRDVIRDADGKRLGLNDLLADLRAETADRVDLAGLKLTWDMAEFPDGPLARDSVKALRALLREATSNVLRHAEATRIVVSVRLHENLLAIDIEDDGRGFDVLALEAGCGLRNMRQRIEALGGKFGISSDPHGTRIEARLPLEAQL